MEENAAGVVKKKHQFRVAARAHLQRLDSLLQDFSGNGLAQFVPEEHYAKLYAEATDSKKKAMDEISNKR